MIITSSARHFNQLRSWHELGHELENATLDSYRLTIAATQSPRMVVHKVRVNAHDSLHCSFANAIIAICNTHVLNSAEQLASRLPSHTYSN